MGRKTKSSPAPQTRRRGGLARGIRRLAAICEVLLAGLFFSIEPRGDFPPPPAAPAVTVWLADHGLHAGLILPAEALAAQAPPDGPLPWLARGADWVEIGWGEAAFYQGAVAMGDLGLADIWRALLIPSPSVLHVVRGQGRPAAAFPQSKIVPLTVSTAGFARMAARIDASFARQADGGTAPIGPPLYGVGGFFESTESYHLFRVCNHWVADRLNEAGAPVSSLLGSLPATMRLELYLRAGARAAQ